MNNNKPKTTPTKKKSTPPTKPLTPAKKAVGGKKRLALSRFTKKARKAAKANPPWVNGVLLRNRIDRAIVEVLGSKGALAASVLCARVREHFPEGKRPLLSSIELRAGLLAKKGVLEHIEALGGFALAEEAPPTTPSGRGEVITADSVKEKNALALRTRDAITPDLVTQTLTPVSDALGDLLAFPNEWPQEATLSLDFVLPSGLETAFDRIFGEKPIYTLRWTLVRPVIVGRIVEDVLLECRSESALGCAQHFLAHAEHFVHYGAQRASNKKEAVSLVELKADVLCACAEASKTLQGAVLDNALRFFK